MAGKSNKEAAEGITDPAPNVEVVPEEGKPQVITFKEAGIEGDESAVVTWAILPPADVAYYYLPEQNPTGASYPGVPLGNVLQEQFDNLPKWIQKSIEKSPMYSKDAPAEGEGE